jgi:hypothetical protein
MLSTRLVQIIEDHAEQLTRGLIDDLISNRHTPHYHQLTREELHHRTYNVYHNLGQWLGDEAESAIDSNFTQLGQERFAEGIPLGEIVYSLGLIKYHLQDHIAFCGMVNSAVDLHGDRELQRLVGRFFDKAIYYTVLGFEHEAGWHDMGAAAARTA